MGVISRRIAVAFEQGLRFGNQAVVEHARGAAIDAVVKLVARRD